MSEGQSEEIEFSTSVKIRSHLLYTSSVPYQDMVIKKKLQTAKGFCLNTPCVKNGFFMLLYRVNRKKGLKVDDKAKSHEICPHCSHNLFYTKEYKQIYTHNPFAKSRRDTPTGKGGYYTESDFDLFTCEGNILQEDGLGRGEEIGEGNDKEPNGGLP